MKQENNTPITFEEGDLIENLDLHIDHAEKFLLAKESRIDGKLEVFCANNNRWRIPDRAVNHGDVVEAYRRLRNPTDEIKFLKMQLDNCKYMNAALERSRDYYQKQFIELQEETKQDS
jgi:hypothetical protein